MLRSIPDKIRRMGEAARLIARHAGDVRSAMVLLGCYLATFRSMIDPREVGLCLRIRGRRYPLRMRRRDVFTVAEVLCERQYELQTEIPPNATIIDAGANVGISALWFLAHCPDAVLHVFEPDADNFGYLKENLSFHDRVVYNQCVVGATDEPVRLHVALHGAAHSVVDTGVGERTIEVPSVQLADYCRRQRIHHVDLLKLDVEGSELDAIAGLGERIGDVTVIVGEFHEHLVDQQTFYAHLEKHGFRQVRRSPSAKTESGSVHFFEVAGGRDAG